MLKRNFMDLLQARWAEGKFLCVGLDSDLKQLPEPLRDERFTPANAQQVFNDAIVEATKDIVCAYKPNLAFYRGGNGKYVLRDTITHINKQAPGVPVILDAKQGDIGSSNDGYVEEDFDWYGADAITVHNYLGMEAMKPFLDQKNKGIIVLCKTSNPGSGEFQNLVCKWHDGDHKMYVEPEDAFAYPASLDVGITHTIPFYQAVARNVVTKWNYNGNCGLVVGATFPEELAEVREITGDLPLLIPGIGKQGGDLEKTIQAAKGRRMIINSSSGIIFASSGDDYAQAAGKAAQQTHDEITAIRAA